MNHIIEITKERLENTNVMVVELGYFDFLMSGLSSDDWRETYRYFCEDDGYSVKMVPGKQHVYRIRKKTAESIVAAEDSIDYISKELEKVRKSLANSFHKPNVSIEELDNLSRKEEILEDILKSLLEQKG